MRRNAGIPHANPYPDWISFAICAVLFGTEAVGSATVGTFYALQFFTLIYFSMCVYRFHRIMQQVTFGSYPIKPAAALFNFVPIFNLYWLLAWTSRFASYVNAQRVVKIVPGAVVATLLIESVVVARTIDVAIGIAGIFGVLAYLTNRLRHFADYRDLDAAVDQVTPPVD